MSLTSFLGDLFSRSSSSSQEATRRTARPGLEPLEQRCVPAALVRPVDDWVSQQGTFLVDDTPDTPGGLFVPPAPNYLGWVDPNRLLGVSFDYAGLANETIEDLSGGAISLGTTTDGKVVERSLADGRTEVHVVLHTRDALTWAFNFDPSVPNSFNTSPLTFGARVTDVLAGATPSVGNSVMDVKFINDDPIGSPLPDLLQMLIAPEDGQEVLSFSFRGTARGELREEFGVPDGTTGIVQTTQVGLFNTGFNGAVADGFPAEHVSVRPVGQGNKPDKGNQQEQSSPQEAAWIAAVDALLSENGKKKDKAIDQLLGLG